MVVPSIEDAAVDKARQTANTREELRMCRVKPGIAHAKQKCLLRRPVNGHRRDEALLVMFAIRSEALFADSTWTHKLRRVAEYEN